MRRYTVQYSRAAAEDFESLPAETQERVAVAVDGLKENPRPPGCKKLTGSKNKYRIRVGQYRVIYEIYDKEILVLIVRIAHRKDAYR
jgi:mRNA interferase RelE/StbE